MPPKKVLIVGAGASGMSCAHHLSQHPEKFSPTLVDSISRPGGQAFSIPISPAHGASWLNQGVQGGSPIFRHTLSLMAAHNHPATPVKLQVSFGVGDNFWTNMFRTPILTQHASQIARFVKTLPWLRLAPLAPVWLLLKSLGFGNSFIELLILPSIALFLGTGNATPSVPAVLLERLYASPTVGMWYPPDPESLISVQPPMVVFDELSAFYGAWSKSLESRGVSVRLETTVEAILSRNTAGVTVRLCTPDGQAKVEQYDELVLCVLADTALRILGPQAGWIEKAVLGATKWSDDITVTHCDYEYMQRHYTTSAPPGSSPEGSERNEDGQVFAPMYYVRTAPENRQRIELSFDCTHYQPQFASPGLPPAKDVPMEKHVFQSIFLNQKRDAGLWTRNEIDQKKVIREDWWHQVCHGWTHYVCVVPWMWLVNLLARRGSTLYAGSWTVVNAHEVAVVSGLAAAYRLGADYPWERLEGDLIAWRAFWGYMLLSHGWWVKGRKFGIGKV